MEVAFIVLNMEATKLVLVLSIKVNNVSLVESLISVIDAIGHDLELIPVPELQVHCAQQTSSIVSAL